MNKKAMRVRDYMVRKVVTIPPDSEITRAVRLLIENDISGLVVTDSLGKVVGILTERDCIRIATQSGYFDELGGPVADYMSSPVIMVSPDEDLMNVAIRFIDSKYRRYPVVENGKLLGIISRRDVLRALGHGSWFSRTR